MNMRQWGSKSWLYRCSLLDCDSSSEAAKTLQQLLWLNRKDESHQQEQGTQGKYRLGDFAGLAAGLLFHQEENYVMDLYTVGKSVEQQRQHPCINKKEKRLFEIRDPICCLINLWRIDYICKMLFGSGMRGTKCICAVCGTMSVNSAIMFKIIYN